MNPIGSSESEMTYHIDIRPGIEIAHLRLKVRAFRDLFGQCHLFVRGNWTEAKGDCIFITNRPRPVTEIGSKYLTVDLGAEGLAKVQLEHTGNFVPNQQIILSTQETI